MYAARRQPKAEREYKLKEKFHYEGWHKGREFYPS